MIWYGEGITYMSDVIRRACRVLTLSAEAPNAAALHAAMPDVFDGTESVTNSANTTACPQYMIVADLSTKNLLVCVLGVQNLANAAVVADGWLELNELPGNNYPRAYYRLAVQIQLACPSPPGGMWNSTTVIGHSWGGAIGSILAALLRPVTTYQVRLYTYGAPKYHYVRQSEPWNDIIVRRVFLPEDPVPLLPPIAGQLGGIITNLTNAQVGLLSSYVLANGGVQLTSTPELIPQQAPGMPLIDWATNNLYDLARGPSAFFNSNHALAAYMGRLNLIPAENPWEPDAIAPVVPTDFHRPTASEINLQRGVAIAQNSLVTQATPIASAERALAQANPNLGLRFRGVIRNKKPAVAFGPVIVIWCKTRRFRRRMVRYLNSRLDRAAGRVQF